MPTGGWIGWAYIGEGGDLPLRVWLEEGPEGPAAWFDGVPWRRPGWPARLEQAHDRATLTLEAPNGTPIRLEGVRGDGRWSGDIELLGYAGEFELLHAPGLAFVDPEHYADRPGYYRMSDGDVLEARGLGWGEVVVRSLRTGEQRTLLPTGADRFMVGPARYVPAPVEARYRVRRDGQGSVVSLERTTAGGQTTRGEPFNLRVEDIAFISDGTALAGSVTRPDDDRPRSGIVVLGGSSWETRSSHLFQVRSLAALGFAVVSWDKRGFGESGGKDPVSFAVTAADAVAAAGCLRARGNVTAVGYFGVSRGGWTAPLAVTRDADAAFLILFVPPAASPAVQEQGGRLARMSEAGFADADVEVARHMLEAAWRYIASGSDADWATYAEGRTAAVAVGVPEDALPPASREPEQWQWSSLNMLFDPGPVLGAVQVPVLAVYGENDLDVLTAEHRPRLEAALAAAGNEDVTVITIPGVDHSLALPWNGPLHRSAGRGSEGFGDVMEWLQGRDLAAGR